MSRFELIKKEVILSQTGVDDIAWAIKCLRTQYKLKVVCSTFSNCQIFTVGLIMGLFPQNNTSDEEYATVVEQLNEIRKLCEISKRLCQIDVNKAIFDKIKEHCNVYASMEYQNLTGSNMVSAIIKLV
jgi:hypothetical protein